MTQIIRRSAAIAAAGALELASVALAIPNSYYSGTTSQPAGDYPGRFSMYVGQIAHKHGEWVTQISYYADYTGDGTTCASHFDNAMTLLSPLHRFKGIKIHGASFKAKNIAVTRFDHVTISGSFHGKTVSGSFSEKFNPTPSPKSPIRCSSGKVAFKATKGHAPL